LVVGFRTPQAGLPILAEELISAGAAAAKSWIQ